jgi:predicted ribosome quality control (RQC) complex YloA/Tae2 family protein
VFGAPWTNPAGEVRSDGADRWSDVADSVYPEAIEDAYRMAQSRREAETLSRRIEGALSKDADSLARKIGNLAQDLAEAGRAEEYKRKGELLKCALHHVRVGDAEIVAVDPASGEKVMIQLDPELTPVENLEACFARYRKVSRGVTALQIQLDEARRGLAATQSLRETLQGIMNQAQPDLKSLAALASQPAVGKLITRNAVRSTASRQPGNLSPKRTVPSRLLPKKFRTDEGLEIWVGRSDDGNDYLTTRMAHGNDLFFHLDGYPGSHVILRTEGRAAPPAESILAACELAVHFSKLKNATRADVHVAAVKDVRKPKGAKAGLVFVLKAKNVHLRRDSRRLQNILASRMDV